MAWSRKERNKKGHSTLFFFLLLSSKRVTSLDLDTLLYGDVSFKGTMYWQKGIRHVRLGLYLIVGGIILFTIGLFAEDYQLLSHTSVGYLSGVSYPLYPVGVGLIIVSAVLFIIGFYLIVKEKIQS
jgi:hypothetical protein